MDKWILKGAKNLVKEEAVENITSPTQVKVKVTYLLVTNYAALTYDGSIPVNYPVVPGRFAVGIVTEVGADCYGIEKGARVYFESAKCCNACVACKSGKEDECTNVLIAGRDYDGFMRDFVVCEYTDVSVLPDSVDNFHALCIETVGLAENICDRLNLSAGQRVAVVGCDFTGNIIAQVLQYHKIIPIVIDNNEGVLEKAKSCGIAYCFTPDEEIVNNVMKATSGEMCDAAIYSGNAKISTSLPSSLVGENKQVAFAGFSPMKFSIDAQEFAEKGLTFFGVTNGFGYTDNAINMIVNGAVKLDIFDKQVINDYDPVDLLEKKCNLVGLDKTTMTVIKMIL